MTAVAERFRAQAERTPGAPALESATCRLSYSQLDAWVDRVSGRLADIGVGPDEVVAVMLPRSPALVMSFLAVNRAGAAYLPIDPALPVERIDYMVADAQPTVLVHGEPTRELAERSTTRRRLVVGDGPGDVVAGGLGRRRADPPSEDLAVYLMYTSGSTGRPKGVVMGARAVSNMLDWHCAELRPGPGRRVAQFTAIGFDIAAQEIFSTLVSGAALVVPSEETRRNPLELVKWLAGERITDLFCPNVVLTAVCEEALANGYALPDLSHISQAGEQLTVTDTVRTFLRLRPGRELHNHYGPTETHAATSWVLSEDPVDCPARPPIGTAIPNATVHLLDEELRPVVEEGSGEIYVSGVLLARGYHGRPGLTAERFLPCPFTAPGGRMYRTGDVAHRAGDGSLVYLGRTDQQVKVLGVRVELGEVEGVLRSHEGVADAAVIARGEGSDLRLEAYVVASNGVRLNLELLPQQLEDRLPAVMIPSRFIVVAEMPRNGNGKLDRAALDDAVPRPPEHAPPLGVGPTDEVSGVLARLFAQVLRVDVAPDDDFFAAGGHSLSAAALARHIRHVLGRAVTVSDVMRYRTVGNLARALSATAPVTPPLTRAERTVAPPTSFAQERLWVLDGFHGASGVYNVPLLVHMKGRLDIPALDAAVRDLMVRHESLRTRVRLGRSDLVQEVTAPDNAPMLAIRDARGDGRRVALEAARRPFALDSEAPIRAELFRCGEEEYLLALVVHHIAIDGWSVRPLMRDLAFAYSSRRAGLASPWQPLSVQYADYAIWQRELLHCDAPGSPYQRLSGYWRSELAGAPSLLRCRTDRARPPKPSWRGGRVEVRLGRQLHRGVVDLARRVGCTPFMVIHTALALVLRARDAGDDVVIGAAVGGRPDFQLEDLVGLFVNTVVLRTDLAGDPTLRQVLMRVRNSDLAALEHQDLPFEQLVEMVNPARSLSHNPLVQVMLAFQVGELEAPRLQGLSTSLELGHLGQAKFDLTVELTECFERVTEPDGIRGHIEYATDLYDETTVISLSAELQGCLEILTSADLSVRLSQVALARRNRGSSE